MLDQELAQEMLERDRVQAQKVLQDPQGDTQRKALARRLLEALNTIDKARELHRDDGWGFCTTCAGKPPGNRVALPCPTLVALNGGNPDA